MAPQDDKASIEAAATLRQVSDLVEQLSEGNQEVDADALTGIRDHLKRVVNARPANMVQRFASDSAKLDDSAVGVVTSGTVMMTATAMLSVAASVSAAWDIAPPSPVQDDNAEATLSDIWEVLAQILLKLDDLGDAWGRMPPGQVLALLIALASFLVTLLAYLHPISPPAAGH